MSVVEGWWVREGLKKRMRFDMTEDDRGHVVGRGATIMNIHKATSARLRYQRRAANIILSFMYKYRLSSIYPAESLVTD